MKNTIVVIDAGGRGSVLVDKYSQSPDVSKIIAIPGNDYMEHSSKKPVEIYTHLKTTSVKEIIEICKKENVSFVDVAQDNAVAVGLVDELLRNGIMAMGPSKLAGEIEWNKAWSREFMSRHNISQPEYQIFDDTETAIAYLQKQKDQSWFVKASGLAEGKGALPAKNNAEAEERIIELQKFGDSAKTFLLEKWLQAKTGLAEEFSAFAISDGKTFQTIGYAQDHKRALDGDKGENTGGMGCSTPPLVIDKNIKDQTEKIFKKTLDGLKIEARPYKGILYLGGIIIDRKVYIIEFNARWGDPEAQVIIPGIKNDFFELGEAIINEELDSIKIETDNKARIVVAGSSNGYPGDYSNVKGKQIFGLEKASKIPDVKIYGAGIKIHSNKFYANGGRIFYVTGEGKNIHEARQKAYKAMKLISVEGNNLHYRTDIGWRDARRISK